MTLYSKTPRPKNRAGKATALIALLVGGVIFAMANTRLSFNPAIFQLVGICFMVFSIYLASFYLLREYCIEVERVEKKTGDDEDAGEDTKNDPKREYDLIIYEVKGKRRIKVLHMSLAEFTKMRIVDKDNRKTVKDERKKMRYYTYDSEFCAPVRLELLARYDGEDYSIMTGYDEELFDLLESLGIKKENKKEDQGEN